VGGSEQPLYEFGCKFTQRKWAQTEQSEMIALFHRAASTRSSAYPLSDGAEEMHQITKTIPVSKERHSDVVMDLWMMNG
jgi:hypothetical protein